MFIVVFLITQSQYPLILISFGVFEEVSIQRGRPVNRFGKSLFLFRTINRTCLVGRWLIESRMFPGAKDVGNESLPQNISPRNSRPTTKPITRWKFVHNDSGGAWCCNNGPIKPN